MTQPHDPSQPSQEAASEPDRFHDAMFLERLELNGFRNLQPVTLAFPSALNLISGNNAQGKTNLLEAIHMATALKPFRAGKTRELIHFDKSEALLRAHLRTRPGVREVEVKLSEKARRVRVDGKGLQSLEEFASSIKVILFVPEDLSMIRGAPTERRSWLDRAIYHLYPRHGETVRDYTQIVTQKNRLLSGGEIPPLMREVWDERQAELGAKVMVARSRFVARIQTLFQEGWQEISGSPVRVGLSYRPSHESMVGLEGPELRRVFVGLLEKHAGDELKRGMALVGPHRDELLVTLDGHEAATFGSQGQARMLALCLKMVELRVLLQDRGIVPIFLLDDVSSELDIHRNRYLMGLLAKVGCQVFVTTTSESHVPVDSFSSVSRYRVEGGVIEADLS